MLTIDDLLELLEDGKWHDTRGIMDYSKFHELKVEMVINFLSEFDFVELDKKGQKVKLTPSLCKFLRKIKLIEEKESVSELEVP